MPKDFYALLSPSVSKKVSQAPGAASSEENIRVSSSVKLTKAPGIASLNIELSWRYYSYIPCLRVNIQSLTSVAAAWRTDQLFAEPTYQLMKSLLQ